MARRGDHVRVADRDAGDVLDGHRLLVVGQRVGRAPPERRNVASMQAITVGNVLSAIGSTTRNRDHASHAQNNHVATPPTPARHRSPTGTTSPAQAPTADAPADAPPATPPRPAPPPAGSCAPTPRSPSPPTCRGRRRRGSCRGWPPSTPPPSPDTDPPACPAAPRARASTRPAPARPHNARPCDPS